MLSLKTSGKRFLTKFRVIAGGSGFVHGELTETEQTNQPSYVFVQPRHVLRTNWPTAVKAGMVLQSAMGSKFIVGENGPSEGPEGTLWQSFRLFEPTGQYEWRRRIKQLDPITKQWFDTGNTQLLDTIWAAIEAIDREQFDREIHRQFEQQRIIAGVDLLDDDIVDNHAVTKVDKQLGLSIGVLT